MNGDGMLRARVCFRPLSLVYNRLHRDALGLFVKGTHDTQTKQKCALGMMIIIKKKFNIGEKKNFQY